MVRDGRIVPGNYTLWCMALLNQNPDYETGEFYLDDVGVEIELLPATELQHAKDTRRTETWKGYTVKYPKLGYSRRYSVYIPKDALYTDFAILLQELILMHAEDELEWESRFKRIRKLYAQETGGTR